jgi:hypothetical protein
MRKSYGTRSRQRGAVAVILGIAAFALFAFMGIAVDLAYTYSRKTELQNAADAAALSGALKLNLKAAGVTAARDAAIATFNQNHTNNFVGSTFVITAADMRLGSCPNPDDVLPLRIPNCTFVALSSVTTDAAAGNKSFLEVKTPTQTKNTFFMLVAGTPTTGTLGYSVAGRFVTDVTPIGVCAIDPVNSSSKYTGTNELVEAGFRRGVTYNLFGLNPLAGAPSDPYLVNPVDAPPTACTPSHSSANFTAPFVCNGSSAVVSGGAASVYTNTGMTASLAASVNSRFDDYSAPSPCDVASAPPDTNIKAYHCSPNGNPGCLSPVASQLPEQWMQPGSTALPNQEPVNIIPATHKPFYNLPPAANPNPAGTSFQQYGVLWSYGPAYPADASVPPKAGTTPFTIANAQTLALYNSPASPAIFDPANYPTTTTFPAPTPPAPYNQTSGPYFQAPTHTGTRNRRVLNLVLVDCRNPPINSPGGSCGLMPVVGVGKFFLQIPAVFTGGPSNKHLMVEFAGLIEPVPTAEIKLYR